MVKNPKQFFDDHPKLMTEFSRVYKDVNVAGGSE